MRVEDYPRSLVGNVNEIPLYFDMIHTKGNASRECIIRSSGSEKKHVTVVLSATADGALLPPMLIFKGETVGNKSKIFVFRLGLL